MKETRTLCDYCREPVKEPYIEILGADCRSSSTDPDKLIYNANRSPVFIRYGKWHEYEERYDFCNPTCLVKWFTERIKKAPSQPPPQKEPSGPQT